MKRIKDIVLIVLSIFILSSCYTIKWCNTHPEWNPPQGYDWAATQCKARSSSVSGYDWIDSALSKQKAYNSCMASYGYELLKISNKQDDKLSN
ncbi:MAG: hypothetical protein WC364_13710 [Eubacteriales bacterium]|jgi:hypothetical protein